MPPKKINLKSQKEKEEKKEDKETVLEKKNSKIIKVDKIDDKTSKKKISIIKSKKTINEPIIEDIKETKDIEDIKETKENEEEKKTQDNEEEDEVQEDNEEEEEKETQDNEEDEVQEDNEEEDKDEIQEDKNKKIISKAKPIIKKDKKTLEKEENQKNHNHSKPKTISISSKVDNNKVDMFEEDDLDFRYVMMNYDFTKNKSEPKITKYEKALLIGKRAKQIEEGANPNVKYHEGQSVISIAEEELKKRKIPFFIRRTIGNKIEYWKPADMEVNMN